MVGVFQGDPVGTGTVDADVLYLDRMATELDGQDAVLSAAGDGGMTGDGYRLEGARRGVRQIDLDAAAAVVGKGAAADRDRRLGTQSVRRGVPDVCAGHGQVLRHALASRGAHRN